MVQIRIHFEMQAHQVTEEQWKTVMGRYTHNQVSQKRSIARVSWNDAQKFMKKLNAKKDGFIYRLPTEAEWEFAARNETKATDFATSGSFAEYGENTGRAGGSSRLDVIQIFPLDEFGRILCGDDGKLPPCPNGEPPPERPNAHNLYNMLGNLPEWVRDWYGPYSEERQIDPVGPQSGTRKVVRGFNWKAPFPGMAFPASRVSFRLGWASDTTQEFGFRCVRETVQASR